MNRCGDCAHGQVVPTDLKVRVCRGGPPQVIVLPGQRGAEIRAMYPVVNATDEGCACFKQKLAIDNTAGNT